MAYIKRDWDNTSDEVTKEDFKRIENGIETNGTTIETQQQQINVLNNGIENLNGKFRKNVLSMRNGWILNPDFQTTLTKTGNLYTISGAILGTTGDIGVVIAVVMPETGGLPSKKVYLELTRDNAQEKVLATLNKQGAIELQQTVATGITYRISGSWEV